MKYYYLDGIEKQGPFDLVELKNCSLTPDTLVFSEGFSSWHPIKDIPELNDFLFALEPEDEPEDLKKNTTKSEQDSKNAREENNQEPVNSKIKIPSILFLFISFFLCIGLSYYIVFIQRQNDSEEINKKIDDIFKSKSAITDYTFDGIDGKLYDVYLGSAWEHLGSNDKDVIRTKKIILAFRPNENNNSDKNAKVWDLFKDVVQYYETSPYNGFNVLRLERSSTIFSVTESWSGDMAYKVPEKKHYEGYSSEYFSSPGYDIPTYRPTIGNCYKEAAKFLTSDKEDKSYEAGSYNKILSFDKIESIFFRLKQRFPIYSRLPNKIHVNHGEGIGEGDLINESRITDATSANDSSVQNGQWIVWFKSITNTYEIEEKKEVFFKYWVIYSTIGIAISCLIYFLLKYRKRFILN